MEKKYFFFDVDGTLVVNYLDKNIPESTKLALKKLKEAGHFVAIATGRSYAMANEFMDVLNIDNMVSDGGNGITIDRQLLSVQPLDYDLSIALMDECKEKGVVYAFSPDNTSRRIAPDGKFYELTHDTYMETQVIEGVNYRDYDEIHKVYIALLDGQEEQLSFLKKLPYARYHKEYIFVEPDDKSIGIRRIVDHFGGEYKDVVVFGDASNDLKMFIPEWTSVAMGNAIDELKAKATYVTDDCDKDGIYNACMHFGWFK